MSTMKTTKSTEVTSEDQYIRRVQLTGRGSYIVSIPKHWIEAAGLKKGGRIEFRRQQNQGLLLTPFDGGKFEDEKAKCEFTVSPEVDPQAVTRKIISLYVIGYSTIEISSRTGSLPSSVRDSIRDVARQKLVGTEMVTESSRSATLQVLLNYPQLLVPDALRRMSSIMSSMQQDAVTALINGDKELATQVIKTDDEIDRFSLYIIRQLKWAVQHQPLLERVGLNTSVECLGYRIITKSVERSGDHASRVAQGSLILNGPLESALAKDTNALAQFAYKMMETALRALYTRDYDLAESVLLEKEKVTALETKLVERMLKEKMAANELSAITLIAESLRRFGEYATDVAEVVLNLTIDKSIHQMAKGQ
jgi:phosphate uptake regulator